MDFLGFPTQLTDWLRHQSLTEGFIFLLAKDDPNNLETQVSQANPNVDPLVIRDFVRALGGDRQLASSYAARITGDSAGLLGLNSADFFYRILESRGHALAATQLPELIKKSLGLEEIDSSKINGTTTKDGSDRATYIVEYQGSRFIFDARSCRLQSIINSLIGTYLEQPKVVLGEGCALWEYIEGFSFEDENFEELKQKLNENTAFRINFINSLAAFIIFGDFQKDKGVGNNIFIKPNGDLALIDFRHRHYQNDADYLTSIIDRRLSSTMTHSLEFILNHIFELNADDFDLKKLIREIFVSFNRLLKNPKTEAKIRAANSKLKWEVADCGEDASVKVDKYFDDLSAISPQRVFKEGIVNAAFFRGSISSSYDFYISLNQETDWNSLAAIRSHPITAVRRIHPNTMRARTRLSQWREVLRNRSAIFRR